jgi:hypothetical protein
MQRLSRSPKHFNKLQRRRSHRRCYRLRDRATESDFLARRANQAVRDWPRTLPQKHLNAVRFASPVSINIGGRS